MEKQVKIILKENEIPKYWYNIVPVIKKVMKVEIPPPLDADTKKPMKWQKLAKILPAELAKQELSLEEYGTVELIKIPDEIREIYKTWRPSPLVRAYNLEKFLKTPAKIYFKREDFSPVFSYKTNSSFAQAYYAKKEGTKMMVADTGPGNWGMAMALACNTMGIKAMIFMLKDKFQEKIDKVTIMKMYNAEVYPSPSNKTKFGRKILKAMKDTGGSIGIGISEALEVVKSSPKYKLCLMSNYADLHQTIIGMELKKQLKKAGVVPDYMTSVVGGGSNFSGFVFPFIKDKVSGKTKTEFIGVESTAVPSFSKGEYKYEFPDTSGMLPKSKMYTLGKEFIPSKSHAVGLNYHGKGALLSLLVNEKVIKTRAYKLDEALKAAHILAQTEKIIVAPESSYAVKAAIDLALECKKKKQKKNIVFLVSGTGMMDAKTYAKNLLKI